MFKRTLSIVITLYTCLLSYAQVEGWQVYPAYRIPVQIEAGGKVVYCIMKGSGTYNSTTGNLVRYDTEDGSIKTYDSLHELTYKEISKISYNKSSQRLLILFTNGSIDLLDEDDDVVNISALKDKSILGENILDIFHYGHMTYLLTGSTLIGIDTEQGIVLDSYNLPTEASTIRLLQDRVYISCSDGLYMTEDLDLLRDKNEWTKVSNSSFTSLCVFANQMYALEKNKVTYLIPNKSGIEQIQTSYGFTKLEAYDEALLCTDAGSVIGIYTTNSPRGIKLVRQSYRWTDKTMVGMDIFACQTDNKVVTYSYSPEENLLSQAGEESIFSFDSPQRDKFYSLSMAGDSLLVAGGINTWVKNTETIFSVMKYEEGTPHWIIFDQEQVTSKHPKLMNHNAVKLVKNPNKTDHFFGAVGGNGLHEYKINEDGTVEFIQLYNYENSPLQYIITPAPDPWNYCTCAALQYDENNNLWMSNHFTDTIVRILRPNGKWLALYYPEISKAQKAYQYLFSRTGIKFLTLYSGSTRGFFGFDTNGTLNVVDDDRKLLRINITNQDETTVTPVNFYCMSEDKSGEIWCGTSEGLFIIKDAREWFDTDFRFHQIKRNRNDGSGLADYFLSGVSVTCIEVDPANRKWIGTAGDGLYLVSADGGVTLAHLTEENSPLISDVIQSIAINPKDGRVFIGTDLGLCSYDENVSKPEDVLLPENVLAYPNPVRPGTNAVVTITGLTQGAEVKILSTSGQVVWGTKSIGGRVQWNCKDLRGEPVASGVYHVVCNTENAGVTVVTKIVVLR